MSKNDHRQMRPLILFSIQLQLQQGLTTGEMGFGRPFAQQQSWAAHVRFGSKADIGARPRDVCFTPKSRPWNSAA